MLHCGSWCKHFIAIFIVVALLTLNIDAESVVPRDHKPINILLLLADDLGYGDTSVEPFVGSEISTPHLKRMAAKGIVMTNFHTAATTCSPTRASILTGLYPWRLGMKAVFEYGDKRRKSNRDDWLVQVPTIATVFADRNYSTYHSGKWHLGGMRNDDVDMRRLKAPPVDEQLLGTAKGYRSCHHPGPNQQGFQEYISVMDGPGAPRQNSLQIRNTLYSQGCQFLLHNDNAVTEQYKLNNGMSIDGWLTACEASHGIRMMNDSVSQKKPFYLQIWFHAPHGKKMKCDPA